MTELRLTANWTAMAALTREPGAAMTRGPGGTRWLHTAASPAGTKDLPWNGVSVAGEGPLRTRMTATQFNVARPVDFLNQRRPGRQRVCIMTDC